MTQSGSTTGSPTTGPYSIGSDVWPGLSNTMGLDVTAYESAVLLPEHERDGDACYDAGHVRAFCYAEHRQSFRQTEGALRRD